MAVSKAHVARSAGSGADYRELIREDRIHGSLYTSEAIFKDEMERIFRQGWVYVGHESEIPKRGDFVRRQIAGDQVIVVRAQDDKINVFLNRCAHRGNLLCSDNSGSARAIVCKYHGWAYDLEGNLIDVPYPAGMTCDKQKLGLNALPRVDSYRGFYFASFNEQVIPLDQHLGKATDLIDRACEMSPTGKLRLDGGWVQHRFKSNWKMLPENDVDGYHVNFVHPSFAQAIRSNYDAAAFKNEEDLVSEARYWGNGHTEIDFSKAYTKPLEWFGCDESRFPVYVAKMREAYGVDDGNRKLTAGPPHACIFPNLFLGEGNVGMFEPISADECIHWHTPLLLEDVEQGVNDRLKRQSEGALGPAAFLLADDAVIAERTQQALGESGGWLDLSRGIEREHEEDGVMIGHLTDEVTNRGFWHHYRRIMTGDAEPARLVKVA
ncbi:aromatic ring-hydroxylating oxygenase subunit alpha [Croceicoccus pelagius]|uniref:Ring-hydroxylating oxygenase subunit alpha n=1 Tax=Croceicoccus pelagius TaxID=1703341 RepID=A0A916YJW6_9SPHN|nr:aromatic ring-hydroxylating dioxygenase subunit alpha [Croceicoccus pelagius]GGD47867.1 ring-hydroxylating oxygenase subunit alpha [Croceicoccus pelagius]